MGVTQAAVKAAKIEAALTSAAAKKPPATKAAHTARGLAQDRRQVSGEVKYEAKKMRVTQAAVKAAIKKVGNDRAKI